MGTGASTLRKWNQRMAIISVVIHEKTEILYFQFPMVFEGSYMCPLHSFNYLFV